MRSKNSDCPSNGDVSIQCPANDVHVEDKEKLKDEPSEEGTGETEPSEPMRTSHKSAKALKQTWRLLDLSRKDLVSLLGVMEGEVQAREDVIHVLSSKLASPQALEAHYGSTGHVKALQALHRDGLLSASRHPADQVYEMPMAELERLEDKHRETYRRMLGQLLLAEKCHRRTVNELDSEKRKHADYMAKSDDFTSLLEQERERLKRLLEQEKAYQSRKERDHAKQLEKVRAELVKLKSFALMLVDERQLHMEQIDRQSQKVQDLVQKLQDKEQKLSVLSGRAIEDGQKVAKLEAELELRAARLVQEHEERATKLAGNESQTRQLRLKAAGLSRKIEELEENNKVLRRSEEELQELRNKISKGECDNSSLVAELETLRKRVMEMEGKDEEIMKTESQCMELRKKLLDEEGRSKDLKVDVEKLQRRMGELETLEAVFSTSKLECAQLHASLEKERHVTKELTRELDLVKSHMKELEGSELRLEKVEAGLKDDLKKLKSFTMIMVEERKNMAERIRQEEQKNYDLGKMMKTEQEKVMEVTEKLIEESKRLLKLKSEMEAKVTTLTKEKDEVKSRLVSEEEKCKDLSSQVNSMKQRIAETEKAEHETSQSNVMKESGGRTNLSRGDNRVEELTLEIERLKHRLKQLEVVEGDLMKTEDEYDLLEKKFRTEQDKANVLSQQLEEMKSQITRNKAIEKGEAVSQEVELRQRCKMEEAKSRDLQADVVALKEKIHELMNKEDQLSQLQVDYSVLQRRFMEEEKKRASMSNEVLNLTKELEVTKRYSRALRPSMNGRRMVDVPITSTGVQTEAVASESAEEDAAAVFIMQSVQEENHIMSNLRQKGLKKPCERPAVLERYPPAATDVSVRKSWIPWMRKKESVPQGGPEKSAHANGDHVHSEVTVSQKQVQPLHIRVTPDRENSTATLQISSPGTKDFFSSTTVIPTLGLQKPRITIIPGHTAISPSHKAGEGSQGPERAKSPVSITTISRTKSPERRKSSPSDRPMSPLSFVTVSASPTLELSSSPESQEMTMGRAVFKVTPEKQMVPTSIRKYNSNTSIITTTEDNKIHIHLGSQFKKPPESSGPTITVTPLAVTAENKEVATGTVLRSPRHAVSATKTSAGKVMSSLMITPVTSAPSKPTQSMDGQSPRVVPTRIPVSKGAKGMKAGSGPPGVSTVTKMESRSEGQLMKIELKRSTIGVSASPTGGKG